jgi:pyruvate dehydrogenase E2 component (dihydrolipoamide acetyltransferase)
MITRVVLAKLSPTMEEGTIVKWSKKEGDAIKVGDVLAEIETDKANMEMEALGSGVLRKILVQAGGKAPIGSLIGVIADANEDISATIAEAAKAAPAAAPQPAAAAPGSRTGRARSPGSRSRDRRSGSASHTPGCAAPAPAPVLAAVPAPAAAPGGRVKSSPLARAIAAQKNVPLALVAGSGPGGRIVKRDVEGYIASPRPAAAPAGAPAAARQAVPVPSVPPARRSRSRTSAA